MLDPVVSELLTAWMAREDEFDKQRRQLRAAVVAYADQTGKNPTPALSFLSSLREECDAILRSLIACIDDTRPATS